MDRLWKVNVTKTANTWYGGGQKACHTAAMVYIWRWPKFLILALKLRHLGERNYFKLEPILSKLGTVQISATLKSTSWACLWVKHCWIMKVESGHRSKFSNLSNWKEEAWKKSGLQRDSNPWPQRYRCDALPTELWSHTLKPWFFFQASSFQLLKLENLLRWSLFTFTL